jgi:hypothetical protein
MNQKARFQNLQEKAQSHYEITGDMDAALTMDAAWDNACDTFGHNEEHTDFYSVALSSIQDSIDANGLQEKLYPWFKKNGFTI